MVASYAAVMPSFRGVLGEENLFRIVAYIKSLATASVQEGRR